MSEAEESTQQSSEGPQAQAEEVLTVSYERLRHSDDAQELSRLARQTLPDRSDQAAFSRATALLEAVAGNEHTPVEDRVFLAETMPFPNILVKLSQDPEPQVRRAVAANKDDKNWLAGLLTKDPDQGVRAAALANPMTSWKMRLEGAQSEDTDSQTLDFLGQLGVDIESDAPVVLAAMVRRAVALNSSSEASTIERLKSDKDASVAKAAASR
ncbi:AbrB family transcriptional regulator [Bombiscardovia nodaiensis]|uniref:AbrB family transcriptional regulator n=1 Tax=Bombiscardovia nodaiensis TaxID=2932181 RepID=A0ABM8B6G4_9BIFI|nr:AbrB family transcriptional regulator [Bombiscardovia nodaiensis]